LITTTISTTVAITVASWYGRRNPEPKCIIEEGS
jgi:hypothetical protein